jgi:hypothetical protein
VSILILNALLILDWSIHFSDILACLFFEQFFTKLLHFFELPISYQGMRGAGGSGTMDLGSMVNLIVSCLVSRGGEHASLPFV